MARYPRTQDKITQLARNVIDGFENHPDDFPRGDKEALQAALEGYLVQGDRLSQAQAAFSVAAADKQKSLDRLNSCLKQQIRLSETDCAENPSRLSEIGWGQKSQPAPRTVPFQPGDFTCTHQGPGTVSFKFKRAKGGERPACYILQRRGPLADAEDNGRWQMVDFYYDTEITAKDQPKGIKLEYRIIASAPCGQSLPSNTVAVVL